MKIEVYKLFESLDNPKPVMLAGTSDGYRLASSCREKYIENQKIELDFHDVASMSASAVCAFWDYLVEHIGKNAIKNITFINLNPMLLDALKQGHQRCVYSMSKPA